MILFLWMAASSSPILTKFSSSFLLILFMSRMIFKQFPSSADSSNFENKTFYYSYFSSSQEKLKEEARSLLDEQRLFSWKLVAPLKGVYLSRVRSICGQFGLSLKLVYMAYPLLSKLSDLWVTMGLMEGLRESELIPLMGFCIKLIKISIQQSTDGHIQFLIQWRTIISQYWCRLSQDLRIFSSINYFVSLVSYFPSRVDRILSHSMLKRTLPLRILPTFWL